MKKIIVALLSVLCLCSCSSKSYSPVVTTDFSLSAVYKTGDFSYDCIIEKKDGVVSIKPTSTRAKGLTITYDGRDVTFIRNSMLYTLEKSRVDSTNPALVVYEVFSCIEGISQSDVVRQGNEFRYTGKTSVGDFVFLQNEDNSYKSVSVPDADINIIFTT